MARDKMEYIISCLCFIILCLNIYNSTNRVNVINRARHLVYINRQAVLQPSTGFPININPTPKDYFKYFFYSYDISTGFIA